MPSSAKPLVLLVDDFPDAREMYSEYLAFSGYRVAEAANGAEALEQAVRIRPSIILMDLSMPVMDGWEATRRLKADPRTRQIPVVALTGHALSGTSDEARAAGCDDFIAKPCLPKDLVNKVAALLANASPGGSRPARVEAATGRAKAPKRVDAGSAQGMDRKKRPRGGSGKSARSSTPRRAR